MTKRTMTKRAVTKIRAAFVSLLMLAAMIGVVAAPVPARAETLAHAETPCSNSICFATVEDGFAFQSYPATTPRNKCEPVIDGQPPGFATPRITAGTSSMPVIARVPQGSSTHAPRATCSGRGTGRSEARSAPVPPGNR